MLEVIEGFEIREDERKGFILWCLFNGKEQEGFYTNITEALIELDKVLEENGKPPREHGIRYRKRLRKV